MCWSNQVNECFKVLIFTVCIELFKPSLTFIYKVFNSVNYNHSTLSPKTKTLSLLSG